MPSEQWIFVCFFFAHFHVDFFRQVIFPSIDSKKERKSTAAWQWTFADFLLTRQVTVARLFHIFEMVYFSPPNWLLDVQCVFIIGARDLRTYCRSTMAHRFVVKKEFSIEIHISLRVVIISLHIFHPRTFTRLYPPQTVYVRKNSTSSSKYIHQLYLLHNGYLISVKRFTLSCLRIAKLAAKENEKRKWKLTWNKLSWETR